MLVFPVSVIVETDIENLLAILTRVLFLDLIFMVDLCMKNFFARVEECFRAVVTGDCFLPRVTSQVAPQSGISRGSNASKSTNMADDFLHFKMVSLDVLDKFVQTPPLPRRWATLQDAAEWADSCMELLVGSTVLCIEIRTSAKFAIELSGDVEMCLSYVGTQLMPQRITFSTKFTDGPHIWILMSVASMTLVGCDLFKF